jgi:hypothetical protein
VNVPRSREAIRLAGLRGEYIEEARRRLTEQGIWDEATVTFVTVRRAWFPLNSFEGNSRVSVDKVQVT